jgi:hypothetical protein
LVDSTPVECARSRETVKRGGASSLNDALANAADYGYCASHSRYFWGFRLHALFALDGTPRALALTSPKIDEKLVCLQLVARCERQPRQILILIGDKNFRGKDFEAELAKLDAQIMRPRRKDERGRAPSTSICLPTTPPHNPRPPQRPWHYSSRGPFVCADGIENRLMAEVEGIRRLTEQDEDWQ